MGAAGAREPEAALNEQAAPAPVRAKVFQSRFNLGAADNNLAWKRWHRRVAKALSRRTKLSAGPNIGTVLLRITIYRDRELRVDLLSSSNQRLGDNCLKAARTLNGDPLLAFPEGSKREEMLFNFQFNNKLFTFPRTDYIKDDLEKIDQERAEQDKNDR
jgi:hypothetical protein